MLDYDIILFVDYENTLCPLFPQWWANQPTVIELENLLSNHEVLIKQMTSSNELSPKSEAFIKQRESIQKREVIKEAI